MGIFKEGWTNKIHSGPVVQSKKMQARPLQILSGVSRLQRYAGNSALQEARIQRACHCGGTCSGCAERDDRTRLQTKLEVGPVNDPFEQEADAVAAQVMRMPEPLQETNKGAPVIRRLSESSSGFEPSSDFSLPKNSGHPLSVATRDFMESRFGADFSAVRLHTGAEAERSAAQINARAYTYGNHVTLGKGASEGDKLLMAHELTHVVQQGGAQKETPAGDVVQRLPFGITLPTGLRFLDATERTMASGVYGSSLNFSKVLLSDAVGGGGRPFTTYVPSPVPGISGGTVINIGPSAYATPGSNRDLLIHELAHSWQSQHHPNPAAFMLNSIASQAAAAAAGGGASAYCYVPGKWFGLYGAEQIAEQVENGEASIIASVASASSGAVHMGNVASLAVPHWETRGDPGVKC